MNKDFNKAKVPVPNKSRHNLGNTFVGSLSWGRLTPIYTKQVAPGEVVNYRPHILVQTPPFASLTFAGIKVKQFSFFVPNRLLWDDFTDFVVAPSAARLDMAEFVGSSERRLNPQMVVSQSATDNADLAERAAFGQLFFDADYQKYIAKEHGIFISLLCIVPEVEYCDGIERMWTMDYKEDYFQPEFENLGFEAIYQYELEAPTYSEVHVDGNKVFGFVPRYSWMKWKRGVLAGDFVRSDTNEGADTWHSFRRFTGKVETSLNPKFVEVHPNDDNNNWDRLFVVTNNLIDPFKVNVWNENDAILPMEGTLTPALDAIYELDGKRIHVPYGGVRL